MAQVSIIKPEGDHDLGFVVAEANGFRSRETGILASGQVAVLAPGTVLGTITSGGKFAEYTTAETDGSQVATAILAFETDATTADQEVTVLVRDAEVNDAEIIVEPSGAPSGPEIQDAKDDLILQNIHFRAAI
jgi:hypothetical protein